MCTNQIEQVTRCICAGYSAELKCSYIVQSGFTVWGFGSESECRIIIHYSDPPNQEQPCTNLGGVLAYRTQEEDNCFTTVFRVANFTRAFDNQTVTCMHDGDMNFDSNSMTLKITGEH